MNVSTYVGTTLAGIPGGLSATLGVVTPSFLIILLVAKGYERFRENPVVRGCMSGLTPGVVGLIAAALVSVGTTVFFSAGLTASVLSSPAFWCSLAIFAGSAVLAFRKLHPILIICLSAALGLAAGYALGLPV